MRFYLIDDSPNIINILKIIIQERELGQVCGSAEHAADAHKEARRRARPVGDPFAPEEEADHEEN